MDGVDHINVDVNDLDACHQFYDDVLSLELLRPPEDFNGKHAMFQAGDTVVTLAETDRGEQWDEIGLDHPLDKAHIAFETDRSEYESLIDAFDGQFPKQGPYDWGEFEGFYFLDPSGNLLEVITYDPPPEGMDRTLLDHDSIDG
jgi:catechol 2,3-dioxygenase-like lactoylglutathione lyase family enzyme